MNSGLGFRGANPIGQAECVVFFSLLLATHALHSSCVERARIGILLS